MPLQKLVSGAALFVWSLMPCVAAAEIAIAIAGPMKGQFGQFGAQMQAGAEMAVADINASGGVNGETLVLEVVDDNCDAETARAVSNQLIGRGVVFVAGHFCFGASIAASEVYAQAGIVQMSPATTLPGYTDNRVGDGVFRLAPRDDAQAKVAGRLLAEEMGDKRIAILHDKTAYGKGLTDAVKSVMNDLGITEVMALDFDAGEEDYRFLVSQLGLEGVEVVYLGGYATEAGRIKAEMARQGLEAVLIAGDGAISQDFWNESGEAGNGTLLTYPEVPRELSSATEVVAALEEAGQPAARYALTTYAAIQAWAGAVEQSGGTELETVSAALREGSFDTVLGQVSFDKNGDSNRPTFVWYEWRDGSLVPR